MAIATLNDLIDHVAADASEACTVTVENNTPDGWSAVIVKIGCQFIYKDGSTFLDGPKDAYITARQSYTITANKKDCVKGIRLALVIRVPNQPDQPVGNEDAAPSNQCFAHPDYSLIPRQLVAEAELGTPISRFELLKRSV